MEKQKIRQFRKSLRKFERLTNLQLKNCCASVTLAQCHVLLEIEENDRTTTGQLSKLLNLEKSTVSRTIDDLVNLGLVERIPHPSDRRSIWIALTPQGIAVCAEIHTKSDAYYSQVFKGILEEDIENVLRNFQTLVMAFLDHENQVDMEKEKCCECADDINKRSEMSDEQ